MLTIHLCINTSSKVFYCRKKIKPSGWPAIRGLEVKDNKNDESSCADLCYNAYCIQGLEHFLSLRLNYCKGQWFDNLFVSHFWRSFAGY